MEIDEDSSSTSDEESDPFPQYPKVREITIADLRLNLSKKYTQCSKRKVGFHELKRVIEELTILCEQQPSLPAPTNSTGVKTKGKLSPLMFDSQRGTPKLPFEYGTACRDKDGRIQEAMLTLSVADDSLIQYSTSITFIDESREGGPQEGQSPLLFSCMDGVEPPQITSRKRQSSKKRLKIFIVNPILRHLNGNDGSVISPVRTAKGSEPKTENSASLPSIRGSDGRKMRNRGEMATGKKSGSLSEERTASFYLKRDIMSPARPQTFSKRSPGAKALRVAPNSLFLKRIPEGQHTSEHIGKRRYTNHADSDLREPRHRFEGKKQPSHRL